MTHDEAIEYFDYNYKTGIVTRKKRLPNDHNGNSMKNPNGSLLKTKTNQYLAFRFKSKTYKAHRIAWLIHYGIEANDLIDHIDRNGLNNAIHNLRIVTNKDNCRNAKMQSNNTSGHTGVYKTITKKGTIRWVAKIGNGSGRKMINIGNYDTKAEAIQARLDKEKEMRYHPSHGK